MVQQSMPWLDPVSLEGSDIGLRTLFQSFLPTGINPLQQQQFSSLFQPTFGQFLGQLGSQIRQGQAPTLTFNQFLKDEFNPQKALLRQPNARAITYGGPTIFRY